MRLIVLLDEKLNKAKIRCDDIILTQSLNDCTYYEKINKIYMVDFKLCQANDAIAKEINDLFLYINEKYRKHRNVFYPRVFCPIYSIVEQISLIIKNDCVDELVLVGGSDYLFLSLTNAEGEGIKKWYRTSWFLNTVINVYFKDTINITWISKENALKMKWIGRIRENYFFLTSLIIKICVAILKQNKESIIKNKYEINFLAIANLELQFSHLQSLLLEQYNICPITIVSNNICNSEKKNIIFRNRLGIKDLFKVIKQTCSYPSILSGLRNLQLKIGDAQITIDDKQFNRAFRIQYFGYLCYFKELCNTIETLNVSKEAYLITDMTFGDDIIACHDVAQRYGLKHYNFQYVTMGKYLIPNLDLADKYFLYAKSTYELYRRYNDSYEFYLPIRKKPDESAAMSLGVRKVVLFTQPDQYTDRYLYLIDNLAREIQINNMQNKIHLTIKLHYRQDKLEEFQKFVTNYPFINIANVNDSCENLLLKSDISISMTSSVLFEALMLGKMSIIANLDNQDYNIIYNSDICFPNINFVANSIDEIIKICFVDYESYYENFKLRYEQYVLEINCNITDKEIFHDI